ncbi:chromosome initiation inhibitor [Escherichia coli]|uniref:Chromosome initiation inhibitor n=1 Tax=Escherichia coli TaxID=562 RepID=A0A376NVW1_ECOLX|nr:chromosome initiation inhibitor [Escherichia coli]
MNEDLSARHKSCALHNQPSHSALSNWKICSGSRCWCVPYRRARTEQGQKLLALLRQVELLEEEWLGDEQTGSTPLLLSLAVNADSLATWLLPALAPVLADSPIRLNLQVEDETRTQERLRRGEVVGAVSIQHQALPSCLVDKLGALDYLFVSSKPFAEKIFP